jgi:hypothetical protein
MRDSQIHPHYQAMPDPPRRRLPQSPRKSGRRRRKAWHVGIHQIRLRVPAARCARVVAESFAPKWRAWGYPKGGSGECRVPVAPAASCAKVESTRVSHHGRTGTPGIPARNGFNGFLRALPGDRALLSPSSRGHPRNLTPTIEASGPHDFAVREPSASRQERNPRPPHPRPTSVTIAKRPSVSGRDGERSAGDLPQTATEIFLQRGLDRQISESIGFY